jgi:hypothetical protein
MAWLKARPSRVPTGCCAGEARRGRVVSGLTRVRGAGYRVDSCVTSEHGTVQIHLCGTPWHVSESEKESVTVRRTVTPETR